MSLLSECHGEEVVDIHRHLWQLFSHSAIAFPEREAVVSMWQSDCGDDAGATKDQCLRWTYRDLQYKAEAVASWLHAQGCRPGTHLVVFLWNSAEWALMFWAAVRAGMVFVPLDPRSIPADAGYLIDILKPAAIVVQDSEAEDGLECASLIADSVIRISCDAATTRPGWTTLPQVLGEHNTSDATTTPRDAPRSGEQTAIIILSSGTTSRPKGCLLSAANLWSQTHLYDPNPPAGPPWRWLVHTPVSHIFGVNNALRAWRYGDTVVFPSRSFDVNATLRALVEERCSVMSAVPPLLKALLVHPQFPGKEKLCLEYVTLGSMTITEKDIRMCLDQFGAKAAVQAFGMSEGAPITSWIRGDPLLEDGWHAGVGKVLPGARIKICAPEGQVPLRRGEVGELHIGGPSVIRGYLGGADSEAFYNDDSGLWMKTGDQACMDDDGVLHLLGRYKDIIIRAGENISPMKIEAALAEIPGVIAQVVGVEDPVAGQVPVAIVPKLPESCTKVTLLEKARYLGRHFILDEVYTWADLGLKSFPMTVSGKVRKNDLRKIVEEFRAKSNSPCSTIGAASSSSGDTEADDASSAVSETRSEPYVTEQLLAAWEELIGSRPPLDTSFDKFADSITIMKFCGQSPSKIGQRVYLQDLMNHRTVRALAELVASRRQSPGISRSNDYPTVPHPPHTGLVEEEPGTKSARVADILKPEYEAESSVSWTETPGREMAVVSTLSTLGLRIEDVEDTVLVPDFLGSTLSHPQNLQSFKYRACFELRVTDKAHIKHALQLALESRPMLRSVLVKLTSGQVTHLIIRPCDSVFANIINSEEVTDDGALETTLADESSHLLPVQLMTQARIIIVQATGAVTLAITTSYSVADVNSITSFFCDLDRILSAPDPNTVIVPRLVPFKWYVDLLHMYATSCPAQQAVDATAHRLRGISKIKPWPLRSLSAESHNVVGAYVRVNKIIILPEVEDLRPKVPAEAFARAALTLFTVSQTGSSHAVHAVQEPARSWPFVPDWVTARLPPARDIAGPTTQRIVCMSEVNLGRNAGRIDAGETLGEFVTRVAAEMELARQHAHVPWLGLLEAMGSEATAVEDAMKGQLFVWDDSLKLVGRGADMESLEPVGRTDWPGAALCWNISLVDVAHLFIGLTCDSSLLVVDDLGAYLDAYANIMRQLSRLDNWGRLVGDVLGDSLHEAI